MALKVPAVWQAALERVQQDLRRRLAPGCVGWVKPRGIHVTLRFLGPCPPEQVADITRALGPAVGKQPAFQLGLGGLGSFGSPRRLRVIWVGLADGECRLEVLAGTVNRALEPLGFDPPPRGFSGHLTLGRVRRHAAPRQCREVHRLLPLMAVPVLPPFQVESVALLRSHLEARGARYECLASLPLAPP